MEHHQKNARGNSIITEMFTRLFRMPGKFENQLYVSQVQQAMAMGIGIEYWRSTRPICMGTLYWQLNDNWPVASWSSIEYSGRWKQLHYHARRAYNPVMMTAYIKDNSLQLWGVNDCPEAVEVSCSGGIYNLEGELLHAIPEKLTLDAEGASCQMTLPGSDWQFKADEVFFKVTYQAQTSAGEVTGEKQLFLTEPKRVALPQPQFDVLCKDNGDSTFGVIITANQPAFYVHSGS